MIVLEREQLAPGVYYEPSSRLLVVVWEEYAAGKFAVFADHTNARRIALRDVVKDYSGAAEVWGVVIEELRFAPVEETYE